ncbi:DNA polymerase III subunits gamma and tau [Mucinivorans hirudinis]|uniref:DNA polymerase III subunit gamma/tau n=1 Tax=Mucinivorans hirudinis TaxID=1433126 RepID=A0A060RCU5_9BACT|nr:DNA polymerase III subunits gamma and tau [Mucinivorans hirudinis]
MENFIVSARKFRPQTFRSVVGQQHITRTLKNAIERGKLAHAYLFTGPRGVGKTSCARIFARTINCLNPTAEYEACGTCESCVSFAKDRSFNIHELDAASNNSVDDIRALTEKVRIAPQVGKYSVYIIDEVHMLSTAAFNAFLKTLEEPPHYAIFILATTEKHKILPTILSRCQVYDFSRIRVEDIVDYLKYIASEQGVSYDEESLHIIAQKADGGMRDALSTFDRVVSFCGVNLSASQVAESIGALDFATYFRATELALGESFTELLLLLDSTIQRGFDAQIFLAGLSEHLRNLLVAKNPQTLSLLEASEGLSVQYQRQAAEADYDFLFNAINLLNQADTTYKASTNRRLHSELALIKLCALKKKEPIAERYPMPQIVVEARATERTEATGSNPISPDLPVLNVPPVPIAAPPAAPAAAPPAAPAAPPPHLPPHLPPPPPHPPPRKSVQSPVSPSHPPPLGRNSRRSLLVRR